MLINYNKVIDRLAADMDDRVTRNKLIASNVANLDTPGYKAKDVKFERILADNMDEITMKRTHVKHMDNGSGTIRQNEIVENPNPGRPDGNNVNVDEEMLKLSENNIQYNVAVTLIAKKLQHIKTAIAAK
jgi:flagellar basal-body rod protein FlgB